MSARPRTRLNLALTAVLGLTVLVLVNYISSRHYTRWDWTTEGLFTLSDRSQQVIRELDDDVQIYVFLGRDEQDRVESLKNEPRRDILTQTLALHGLFEDGEEGGRFALYAYAVLALLFMLVDTIPLIVKFFSKVVKNKLPSVH